MYIVTKASSLFVVSKNCVSKIYDVSSILLRPMRAAQIQVQVVVRHHVGKKTLPPSPQALILYITQILLHTTLYLMTCYFSCSLVATKQRS